MNPAEREARAREHAERAFELRTPNVLGNPFIPKTHFPFAKQCHFLGMHRFGDKTDTDEVFEALYGGAAGGGKSDVLIMAAAQYAWKDPDFAGILFRRTLTDLNQPGALLDRAMSWWKPQGVHWNGNTHKFTFPNGAQVQMGYLRNPNDHLNYQGAAFQLTGWDELTQWPSDAQYRYVGLSRVRRLAGSKTPLRTLSTSNPGGPGHVWVKARFIGGIDPTTGEPVDAIHPYLPSSVLDNPYLDRDAYIRTLEHLHPTVRDQLLKGDWEARDPGDYFRREWFGPLLNPSEDLWPSRDCVRIRWWDLAASEKPDAAFTAGVRMAKHLSGVRAIEHCVAFRATPGKRDDLIVQTAQADGRSVVVGIEIEGGSGGPAQFYALEKRLKAQGFRVAGARPRAELTDREGRVLIRNPTAETGKMARADPVASCLERGYQRRGESPNTGSSWWGLDQALDPPNQRDGIRLFSGKWTQAYLDVVEGFPEGDTCDEVDATSGAWAWLEAHGPGSQRPPRFREDPPTGDVKDMHPEDRPKPPRVAQSRHAPI